MTLVGDSEVRNKLADLRVEVLSYLEGALALISRAGAPLQREEHYRDLAGIIRIEINKVRELELRMSIVAPMKAGKSTIVNAILGQSILPARTTAMTTIPSEIVCDDQLTEPRLHVPLDTIERFQRVWRKLHKEVVQRGMDAVMDETSTYAELAPILRQLSQQPELELAPQVEGTANVQQVLLLLNDLCRLAPAVVPGLTPFEGNASFEAPRLAVRFLQIRPEAVGGDGRLVIVDTPGPNEAHQHGLLTEIVAAQLRSTSVVLLVLDFSQLNTAAADAMSQNVQRVTDMVGEENLLVLINKIDERDEDKPEKSMTPEQVRQFVAGHLNLKHPAQAERVFEVSAKWAQAAANFFRELGALGGSPSDEAVRELPSARELAPHVFGRTDWRDELAEASAAKLQRRARTLWENSKFDAFLRVAMEAVIGEVAPRCLAVALKVTRAHLLTLRNDTTLRSKAIAADTALVEREIAELTSEMESLERGRKAIDKKVKAALKALREHLQSARRGLQSYAAISVEDVFREEGYEQESFWKKLKRYGKGMVGFGGGAAPRILRFDTKAEADEFAREALDHVVRCVRPQVEAALSRVDQRVEGTRFDLEAAIESETRPILTRAAQRLREEFDVHLEIPPPDLGNPLEAVTTPDRITRRVAGGYTTEIRYERKWYVLWLWEVPVKYKVKLQDRYVVLLEEITNEVNESIRTKLDDTTRRFEGFLDGEFTDHVDAYYRRLVKYLGFYRDSVRKAHEAQRLSLHDRETTRQDLAKMATEGDESVGLAGQLLRTLRQLQGGDSADEVEPSAFRPPIDVFFSYSHEDEELRRKLHQHLAVLRRQALIRAWYDRDIGAGEEWAGKIDEHLERAQIVLLLVSSSFLDSNYCYDIEMKRALARHEAGTAVVIPVIGRPCDWKNAPFAKLQALPRDGKAIRSWPDIDEAFADIAQGIRMVAARLRTTD